ncbi:origin recognition complex subunit 2-domain-containing protein [Chytridium lagenaria]|nr:origin recognition complex subunit 2-domain-containing protein [Chytridium lagenaria]
MNYFSDITRRKVSKSKGRYAGGLGSLSMERYRELISKAKVKHDKEKNLLISLNALRFAEWQAQLAAGFSILLYGLGSKRILLSSVSVGTSLEKSDFEIDGSDTRFDADVHVLSKLYSICRGDRPGRKEVTSIADRVSGISKYFHDALGSYECFYVIIHSIDGAGVRDPSCQSILSHLKRKCPLGAIRIIGSMDHVNAPLIWDQVLIEDFRWLWKDVTTFSCYETEVEHVSKAMVLEDKSAKRKTANDEALGPCMSCKVLMQMQERFLFFSPQGSWNSRKLK